MRAVGEDCGKRSTVGIYRVYAVYLLTDTIYSIKATDTDDVATVRVSGFFLLGFGLVCVVVGGGRRSIVL